MLLTGVGGKRYNEEPTYNKNIDKLHIAIVGMEVCP